MAGTAPNGTTDSAQPRGGLSTQQPAIQQATVANYQVPQLENFSLKPEDWPRWIKRFERFRKATDLDQKDGKNQVNSLIYSMG